MCGCGRTSTDFGNAGREGHRADVIEEDERADHVPPRERQHAPDFKAPEIATALVDDIHAASFTMEPSGRPFARTAGDCPHYSSEARATLREQSRSTLGRRVYARRPRLLGIENVPIRVTSGIPPGRSSRRRQAEREVRVVVVDHRA